MLSKKVLFIFSSCLLLFLLAGCGDDKATYEGDFEYKVDEFNATNQNGEEVSTADYEGKFWIADFVFTSCTDTCPILTANMSRLQQALKEEELDVQLVTFSVDPDVDQPDVLKEFAEQYSADYANWDFLTGYSVDELSDLAAGSFKVMAGKMNGSPYHANYFHLVTPDGNYIKSYKGTEGASVEEIVEDLNKYIK
jgi:protein SCO1